MVSFEYELPWMKYTLLLTMDTSNIAIQLTACQTFTAPPYSWPLHSVGLLSLSGFTGSLLSFFFGGWLIDWIATRATKSHGQHVEPEYRLPAMVIPAVIGPIGLLTFGIVIATGKSWAGAAIGYGMQGFGATAAANIAVTYVVDAYRPVSENLLTLPSRNGMANMTLIQNRSLGKPS